MTHIRHEFTLISASVLSVTFIVGGVIHLVQESSTDDFETNALIAYHTNDSGLPSNMLRTPGIVPTIKTESAELLRPSTDTNCVNTLGAKFGVGRLTTEFSLLVVSALTTRGRRTIERYLGITIQRLQGTGCETDSAHPCRKVL